MDTICAQRGQSLTLRYTFFQDGDKTTPLDLTGASLTLREASSSELQNITPELFDAAAGQVDLELSEETTQSLGAGRVNWFKLEADFPSGFNLVVPKIWISIDD